MTPEPEVRALVWDAAKRYATGDDLLKAAADHFKIDQKKLAALVEHWRHINSNPAPRTISSVERISF